MSLSPNPCSNCERIGVHGDVLQIGFGILMIVEIRRSVRTPLYGARNIGARPHLVDILPSVSADRRQRVFTDDRAEPQRSLVKVLATRSGWKLTRTEKLTGLAVRIGTLLATEEAPIGDVQNEIVVFVDAVLEAGCSID